MEVTYERKHNESFMVVLGELDTKSYEYKMIRDNDIKSLLDIKCYEIDGVKRISYKISRKETLSDYVESNDLSVELIARFVTNLQMALDEAAKYLIDENHFWLDKDSIFVEKSGDNCKVSLCYIQTDNGTVQTQFRAIMEFFLSKLSTSDRDSSKKIYDAYEICLKEDYTLAEVIECLQMDAYVPSEIYVEKVSLDDEEVETTADFEDAIGAEYISDYYDVEDGKRNSIVNTIIDKTKSIFGRLQFEDKPEPLKAEDFVIEPDYEMDEKTVLLSESKPVGRLVYDGNSNEDDFIINKDVFRIGTGKANDAIIHARTVSGNHAKITKEGNDYYLTDSNSTNGSFLNSLPLVYRKPYKLKPMDVIRFATESYIFL